jgi:TetR/AcrR family transcriptional regulator
MQENPRLPAFILNEVHRNPTRIKKLLKNVEFKKLWLMLVEQHKDELEKYNITEESIPQIMTTIAAISVFPFAARGILEGIFENLGVDFDTYIEERKDFAADFVLSALLNKKK